MRMESLHGGGSQSRVSLAAILWVCLIFFLATTSAARAEPDNPPPDPSPLPDFATLSLDQLANVKIVSASLHEASLRDAPASVSVITAEEIRKFGYRTLAEALAYVPGFYITTDHTYTYLGLQGFSLPGDSDTRIILMIDGHNIADNMSMSSSFGEDFPLDLDLIDRIEIIRGPSSSLYGSNGMLGTINVVTRRPDKTSGTTVRMDSGSGERKIGANTAMALGKGATLLFAASIFNDPGAHELYFNEYDSAQTNFGRAVNMDGEKGYHVFADLIWGHWEALVVAGDRVKIQPVSWGNTIFNDRGTRTEDSRGFFDLSYTRKYSEDRTLNWRTSYDEDRYRGIYHYAQDGGIEDNRENDYGDWIGSKLTYRLPDPGTGHLTLGAEVRIDLRASQNLFDVQPEERQISLTNHPDRQADVFAQQEWSWGPHWEMNLGARLDWSLLNHSAVSPRAALIFKPNPKADVKLLYGRGFRNPGSYDMYYNGNNLMQMTNVNLRPERTDTYEVVAEYNLTKRLRAGAALYQYRVNDLIELMYDSMGQGQFVNADRVSASGTSIELTWMLPRAVEVTSSVEFQRAVYASGAVLPNSPGQVGKLHLSAPLWRNRLTAGAGLQALGQRQTMGGVTLPWQILPEVVVSAKQLPGGLELSAGIKNLSNSFYRDPVGMSNIVDTMIGAGRSYYLNLVWHSSPKE